MSFISLPHCKIRKRHCRAGSIDYIVLFFPSQPKSACPTIQKIFIQPNNIIYPHVQNDNKKQKTTFIIYVSIAGTFAPLTKILQ